MDSDDMDVSPDDHRTLTVAADFPNLSPERLFQHWTEPTLLTLWWPQRAEIDGRPNGGYHLSWPSMDWDLRGTYLEYEPGSRLAFTWHWDHEPNVARQNVTVGISPLRGGSRLLLRHGAHEDSPAGTKNRQEHVEGWHYFLARLQTLT